MIVLPNRINHASSFFFLIDLSCFLPLSFQFFSCILSTLMLTRIIGIIMMTDTITLGNEMIDIEGNDLDNEINNCDDSSKDHKNKNTSNNDDDSSIISDDNSDNINKQMYPSDCYSFLSIYGPTKNPGTFDLLKFVSCTNYYSFAHTSLFCILVRFLFPRCFSI